MNVIGETNREIEMAVKILHTCVVIHQKRLSFIYKLEIWVLHEFKEIYLVQQSNKT